MGCFEAFLSLEFDQIILPGSDPLPTDLIVRRAYAEMYNLAIVRLGTIPDLSEMPGVSACHNRRSGLIMCTYLEPALDG